MHGNKAYFVKLTINLNLGILNFGAKNLKSTWSITKTPKNVPKKALASLLAV